MSIHFSLFSLALTGLASASPSAPACTQTSAVTEFSFDIEGGIEVGSAGWHLVYTSVADPDTLYRGFPQPSEYCVRDWCFWSAEPKYDRAYSDFVAALGLTARIVPVSFRKMTKNTTFSYAAVYNSVEGSYEVHGTLDAFGLGILENLVAPNEVDAVSGDITDWYGISRSPGADFTEMRIALLSDDQVYLPISVTEIMDDVALNGLTEYTSILADGLMEAEAGDLLSKLHGLGAMGTSLCYEADAKVPGVHPVITGDILLGAGSGLHLEVARGVTGQFGYFLVGTGNPEPGIAISENRPCLAATRTKLFGRHNVLGGGLDSINPLDRSGVPRGSSTDLTPCDLDMDLPQLLDGTLLAGSRWHFQLWYRSNKTLMSNFSNGLSVTFM